MEIHVLLLVTAVADAVEAVDALQVGIAHPHALELIVEEDADTVVEEVVRVVRMFVAAHVEVHALELVHLHALETVMENAVIHAMAVQIIAKEIVVTLVLEDVEIQLDAIMVALDVVLLVRQHVVIYARDHVATMNVKLHVHQIADPHVVQLVEMIVAMVAKARVVLIIVLVDATHLV